MQKMNVNQFCGFRNCLMLNKKRDRDGSESDRWINLHVIACTERKVYVRYRFRFFKITLRRR